MIYFIRIRCVEVCFVKIVVGVRVSRVWSDNEDIYSAFRCFVNIKEETWKKRSSQFKKKML